MVTAPNVIRGCSAPATEHGAGEEGKGIHPCPNRERAREAYPTVGTHCQYCVSHFLPMVWHTRANQTRIEGGQRG